jgi:hypothetical protein
MVGDSQFKDGKQVSYVKFVPRLFSTMLDVYLVSLITLYPMKIIASKIFVYDVYESNYLNEYRYQ